VSSVLSIYSAATVALLGNVSLGDLSSPPLNAEWLLRDSRARFGAARITSTTSSSDLAIAVPPSLRDKLSLRRGGAAIDLTPLVSDEAATWIDGVAVFPKNAMLRRVTPHGVEDLYRLDAPRSTFRTGYSVELFGVSARVTEGALELVDARGDIAFQLPAPVAIDANGRQRRGAIAATCDVKHCTIDLAVSTDGLAFPVLIDPAWEATGSLKYTHYNHVALPLKTGLDAGKVLLTAGSGAYLGATEIYDPATRSWGTGEALPTGTDLAEGTRGLVLSNGTVMLAGGIGAAMGSTAQRTVLLRDATTGVWKRGKDMAYGRAYHSMAVVTLDGKERVIVAGGQTQSALSTSAPPLATAEIYAPETDTWTTAGFLKIARTQMASVVLTDGRLAIVGGQTLASGSGKQVDSTEIYDVALDSWISGPKMNTTRTSMGVALLSDNKVLVAGGYGVPAGAFSASVLDTIETLDFTAGTTTVWAGKLTQPRRDVSATRLADGRVVIAGGSTTSGTIASALVDVISGTTVTSAATLAEARLFHATTLLPNGHLLVSGGWTGSNAATQSRTSEVFDLDLGKTCTATTECATGRTCVDGVCCASATCPTGQVCNAAGREGVCVKAKGATCTSSAECATGYCIDGVCCADACTGLCRSCALPGSEGTCTMAASGSDPRASCRGSSDPTCAKKCDGTGKCETSYAPVGTTCGASLGDSGLPFCSAYTCTSSGSCTLGTNKCGLTCVTSSTCEEATKTCSVTGTITAGNCLIDSKCYRTGETKPGDACSVCDPGTKNNAWTVSLLCDAGPVDSGVDAPLMETALDTTFIEEDTLQGDTSAEDTAVVDSAVTETSVDAAVPAADLPAAAACGCDVPGTGRGDAPYLLALVGIVVALRRRKLAAIAALTIGCGANATRDPSQGGLGSDASVTADTEPGFEVGITMDTAASDTPTDTACVGKEVAAIKPPVDIIVIVDQSGSMSSEIAQVKTNINKLSDQLTKAYLDYRVVVIGKQGMGTYEVCVPPPLGGPDCRSNPPVYRASNQEVQSNDALTRVLETYDAVLPSIGWRDMLREESTKIFIPITDDNATAPKPVAPATTIAQMFDSELLKRSAQFGTAEKRRYRFYPICGASATDATVVCGSGMVNTGSSYIDLVKLAGGKWFPLCSTDYGPLFIDMAKSLAGEVACELTIPPAPAGETLDYNKVNVLYTPSDTGKSEVVAQDSGKACASANGWQYNEDRTKVVLCGDACKKVKDDLGSRVSIQFGCRTRID
jgi:hypothetical protein